MLLNSLLDQLYPHQSQNILDTLKPLLDDQAFHQHLPRDWYTHLQFYVTYPNAFSVNQTPGTLQSLINQLDHIKNLGCNAMHLLPFFPSPMIDGGFDVSDFYNVRPELGDTTIMDNLIDQASERGIQLFIDLPLNHVSNLHPWFQEASKGDERLRDYFIHSATKPNLLKYEQTDWGHIAHYQVFDAEVSIPIIFPKQEGELPGWVADTNDHWYFHTFYPHQIDLNWSNPDVFIEICRVIVYWAKKGVSLRIDAAPHLDKQFSGELHRSTDRNHLVIQALRQVCQLANPFAIFLVEVVDNLNTIKTYLQGSPKPEAETAYNFQILNGLWVSLILGQSHELWEALEKTKDIPPHIQWINFLRNHDALMLGFLDSTAPNQVFDLIKTKGEPFDGIQMAGRTASFLDNQPQKIVLAHFLLASLPGNPAIFYGDELGKPNDEAYLNQQTQSKNNQHSQTLEADARDLGRGYIDEALLASPIANDISTQISQIFNTRLTYHQLHTQTPEKLDAPDSVFAARYRLDFNQTLDVYANLTNQEVTLTLDHSKSSVLAINGASVSGEALNLPPHSGVWLK